jgi:hypothetical protein
MTPSEIETQILQLIEFVSEEGPDKSSVVIGSLDRQRTFKAVAQLVWWLRREGLFRYQPSDGVRPLELPALDWARDLRQLASDTSLAGWVEIEGDKMNISRRFDSATCRKFAALAAERFKPKLER